MDPITISATILSVLAVVQNTSRLLGSLLKQHDPRVDQIYYRLLAEKRQTEGWASHLRVLNTANLRAVIPAESYDEVVVLLGKLDSYYKQAQSKYESIERSKKGPPNGQFLKAKFRFVTGGFDDLNQLVATLAAMNEALRIIAPPLPMYSEQVGQERSPTRHAISMTTDAPEAFSIQSPQLAEMEAGAANDTIAKEIRLVDTKSVHLIWSKTLDNLETLSIRRPDPHIAHSASRLRLWGAGLFQMTVPLDTVLQSDQDGSNFLRECILKILVEILVFTEQEFTILSRLKSNQKRLSDEDRAQAITALLGCDELMDLALESWKNLLDRQGDGESASERRILDIRLIPGFVQALFELIPALRAARESYCFDRAESETRLSKAPATTESLAEAIKSQLDAVGEILSKRDQVAGTAGKNVKLHAPVFQKQSERLQEYYASHSRQSSSVDPEAKKIGMKQTELAAILSDYIKNSMAQPEKRKIEGKSPRSKSKLSEKSKGKDTKMLAEDEEQRVDEMISFLRDTTDSMWKISSN